MKFAHLADCHIGSWREPKMREVNSKSFIMAIDKCLNEHVDFVLVAGDLFNTAVPGIDSLKMAVKQLKRLKDAGIYVYFIAGSHDFSPSEKTMLDVLEHAGLAVDVARGEELPGNRLKLYFTIDNKSGAKIAGMLGKRSGLEASYYNQLEKENLENTSGFRIFMFHSALAEIKPEEHMEAMPVSLLPAGFDYYAGGHVHIVDKQSIGKYKNIVYPGPVFPNNFSEIEKLKNGSFVIFDNGSIRHIPLVVHPTVCISVDGSNKTVSEVETIIKEELSGRDLADAIVTIRVSGCLGQGRPVDLNWNDIFHDAYWRKAYFVMRNTNSLTSKEMEVVLIQEANVEEVENSLIEQHASQFKLSQNDIELAKKLMHLLSAEKVEGERIADFESRLHSELDELFQ